MASVNYWEKIYKEKPLKEIPWHSDFPPKRLKKLVENNEIEIGKVLDVCSGAGTNSIYLAEEGFEVTGIDISEQAVKIAKERAEKKGVLERCKFYSKDVLKAELPLNSFNFIIDRGCYHHIPQKKKPEFVQKVHDSLKPGGKYLLYCFSDKNAPWKKNVSLNEIYTNFKGLFEIKEIKDKIWTEPSGKKIYLYQVLSVKDIN